MKWYNERVKRGAGNKSPNKIKVGFYSYVLLTKLF